MQNMGVIPPQLLLSIIIIILVALFVVLRKNHRHQSITKNTVSPIEETNVEFTKQEPEKAQALFIDLSPKSADVVELAVEVWRINNRLAKIEDDLTVTQKRGLESSLQKFITFLDKYYIKIVDHTGEKYNEGMNIEVLSFEKDETVKSPMIKETVEPTITCNNHVIKKGKVIVTTN